MRERFYLKGEHNLRAGYETPIAAIDTLLDPRYWASTAFQVGGFAGATITNNPDGTISFDIVNVAGAHSFFCHRIPNIPGSWCKVPMHNVIQHFHWTEAKYTGL